MSLELRQQFDTLFWVLTLVSLGLVSWTYFSLRQHPRRITFVILRGTVMLGLLFIFLQPVVRWERETTKPLVWQLYLDNSGSMAYHPHQALPSINAGVSRLLETIRKQEVPLETFLFSGTIQGVEGIPEITAEGPSTDLGVVMERIASEKDRLAGAILVTDGQFTQGEDPLQEVSDLSLPLYVVGVGDTVPMVDIAIETVEAPTVAIKGEDVDVTAVVQSSGGMSSRLTVSLYQGKKLIGSKPLQVEGTRALTRARFRFRSQELGLNNYQLRVSSLEEEINIKNNRLNFTITVLKDRYRVALLTGAPNFNTPVLKRYLRDYPRVELDHYVQREKGFQPPIKKFWTTPYELIILDNFPTIDLSVAWQRIFAKKIVANQAALIWIVGPTVTPELGRGLFPFFHVKEMEAILEDQRYPWYVSETGYQWEGLTTLVNSGLTLDSGELLPLRVGLQLETTKEEVEPLAYLSGPIDIPLMLASDIQGLRSFLWTSPDMGRLHYRLTGTAQAELLHQLWQGLLTWALRTGGDKELYFRLNKDSYQQGELITASGTLLPQGGFHPTAAEVILTINQNEEAVNRTELHFNPDKGTWEGQLWASKPGDYTYEISVKEGQKVVRQTGRFQVQESEIELNRVYVNQPLLAGLAKATGGAYVPWPSRADIVAHILPRTLEETHLTIYKLHEELWAVLLIVGLLASEWGLRRRYGLL
ncbi:MAG: hypothetical protein ACE5DP_01865 [Fidelibacterota bacterium]